MVRSIEGIYRLGKVELLEPAPTANESRVIVTFLSTSNGVNLTSQGLDEHQAADLWSRLKSFEQDWLRPDMDVYDAL